MRPGGLPNAPPVRLETNSPPTSFAMPYQMGERRPRRKRQTLSTASPRTKNLGRRLDNELRAGGHVRTDPISSDTTHAAIAPSSNTCNSAPLQQVRITQATCPAPDATRHNSWSWFIARSLPLSPHGFAHRLGKHGAKCGRSVTTQADNPPTRTPTVITASALAIRLKAPYGHL